MVNGTMKIISLGLMIIPFRLLLDWFRCNGGYELVKLKMVCYNLFLCGKEKAAKHYENNKEI